MLHQNNTTRVDIDSARAKCAQVILEHEIIGNRDTRTCWGAPAGDTTVLSLTCSQLH